MPDDDDQILGDDTVDPMSDPLEDPDMLDDTFGGVYGEETDGENW